jgi:hypothetical protein
LKKLFILGAMIATQSVSAVLADTGPKPSMEFEFTHALEGAAPTILAGTLYECDQSDCQDATPLEEVGPQGFRCQPDSCRALAYGFAPYHRIEIEFSDGATRTSNVFATAGFDSKYTVTVRPDDLLVEARFSLGALPRIATVLVLCGCGLLGLVLVVGLGVWLARRSRNV